MIRELLLASACVTLAACQPAPPPSEFDFGIPLKEVMRDVMDPAAFGYWDRQGDVVEAGGTRSLVPPDPATLTDEIALLSERTPQITRDQRHGIGHVGRDRRNTQCQQHGK